MLLKMIIKTKKISIYSTLVFGLLYILGLNTSLTLPDTPKSYLKQNILINYKYIYLLCGTSA